MMTKTPKEEAIKFYESKVWEKMSAKEIAELQLYDRTVLLPFKIFQKSVNECLGRIVNWVEFAEPELLQAEFEGKIKRPTINEIAQKCIDIIGKHNENCKITVLDEGSIGDKELKKLGGSNERLQFN